MKIVLKRARDHGITFNREKCQFGVEQIEVFGHILTKDGLNPSTDKVRAVKECGVPERKEAVRSFLGMAGYLGSFMHQELCSHSDTAVPANQKKN